MRRTYWIRHRTMDGVKFDKVVYTDKDTRPRWHKVGALEAWKQEHKGYAYLQVNAVYTKDEMKANGYM